MSFDKHSNPLIGELFIDAICDVGFKKIMSDEEILVDFLNTFLPDGTPKIVSATLLPDEMLGDGLDDKKVFFDVHAKDNEGKTYIIEVQRKSQDFFTKRSAYYKCREVSSQGKLGELKTYDYSPVYSISVLNFVPNESWAKCYYDVFSSKSDYTNEKFPDDIAQIVILLPLMKLSPEELKDNRAKWCYLLRNAVKLNKEVVRKLKWTENPVFEKMKQTLYVSKLTKEERAMISKQQQIEWDNRAYEDYLKRTATERGLKKGLQQGLQQGLEQGLQQGLQQGLEQGLQQGLEKGRLEKLISIVGNMLAKGMDIKIIAECVNLPEDKDIEIKTSMKK